MPDLPCVHRGRAVRRAACDLCDRRQGNLVPVHACAIHGECTLRKLVRAVRGCAACEDWTPPPDAGRDVSQAASTRPVDN